MSKEKENAYFVFVSGGILKDLDKSRKFLDFLFNKCEANKFSLSGHFFIDNNGKETDYWKDENKEVWSFLKSFFIKQVINSELYGCEQQGGNVFRHKFYKLGKNSLNFLKKTELAKWNVVNLLPDYLCFYKDNKLLAEVTVHEGYIKLYLPKKQLLEFKKMEKKWHTFSLTADKEFGEAMNLFHNIFKNKKTTRCMTRMLESKNDFVKYEMRYEFPEEKYQSLITFVKGKKEDVAEREIELYKNNQLIKKLKNLKDKKDLLKLINNMQF